jgi:hypothetical protein
MVTAVTSDGVLVSDLWIDQPNAMQEVDARAREQQLDPDSQRAAQDVILKGYGIVRLNLPEALYDDIDRQVEQIWRDRPSDVAYGRKSGIWSGTSPFPMCQLSISGPNPGFTVYAAPIRTARLWKIFI